jgi:cysteine desulfurase
VIPAHPAPQGRPVHLDHNATTAVDPRVFDAILPHLEHHFGNPSSSHSYGDQPRHALDQARAGRGPDRGGDGRDGVAP